ncbi:MAG: TonB-dependent receptor [Candidatus Omnitrophica bacterium]|nr:TonB-dependent receptor [Candidatus Omnitrophota bacterium]
MRRITISLAIISALLAPGAFADSTRKLDKIVVTPSRVATELSETSRSLTILDNDAFRQAIYKTIPDLIGEVGGIDIRRRGPENVQADLIIRGTTFEQNTVLIDGINVNDPQTGHFNMDLPLTMMDVEAIEILKGPVSSLYGPNAFGGAVNMITKKPADTFKAVLYAEGGSYDYVNGGVSITTPLGPVKNRFSFEQSRSTGYMSQTEFNILSLTENALIETGIGVYNFLFGYLNKDFGADSFYSNLFPNEYERTDTRFFRMEGVHEIGNLKIETKAYLRNHNDKFVLDQNRTGWQTNYHTTYTYGGEIDFTVENRFMDISYGYELSADTIDSTSMQTHSRTRDSLYLELLPHLAEGLYINTGARLDYFTEFGWQCSPSVSASYHLAKGLTARGLIGRAYRIPTFTDLYYNDASNRGNSGLVPESSWSYETGLDYREDTMTFSATVFRRDTYDTIDWIRYSSKARWQASNIGESEANGLEISFSLMPDKICNWLPVNKIFIEHTMMSIYNKHDYFSKYALDYLKQHLTGGLEWELSGFRNSWILNYKKRIGDSGYVVTDTKLSKDIVRKGNVTFEAFIEISNLFDVKYSEQSDIPMPGRWVKSGGRIEF